VHGADIVSRTVARASRDGRVRARHLDTVRSSRTRSDSRFPLCRHRHASRVASRTMRALASRSTGCQSSLSTLPNLSSLSSSLELSIVRSLGRSSFCSSVSPHRVSRKLHHDTRGVRSGGFKVSQTRADALHHAFSHSPMRVNAARFGRDRRISLTRVNGNA